ncbi:MAG: hypothetical protein DRO65_00480 [Candidatus Altiarchaeales archaeon]|nr:MAG: hypothetical protein DRO65_00480 [Candidatus Altiarchaeales archaeon]
MMDLQISEIISKKIPVVSENASIRNVAKIMEREKSTYVLIENSKGELCGIVTEGDLKRAISKSMDIKKPVTLLMSSPLITISSDSMIWEATIEFFKNRIKHLPVEKDGKIIGVLTIKELALYLSRVPLYFLKEFSKAKNVEEMKESYEKFQKYTLKILPAEFEKDNIDPRYIGNIISMINDEILKTTIKLSLKKLGIKDKNFSFFVMGSEGRREQFLRTDQDNGIIFTNKENRDDFIVLGKEVHRSLLEIGFADCPASYTVGNENFVKSLDDWLSTIEHWSYSLSANDLLNLFVIGDMRHVYGNSNLLLKVRKRLHSLCRNEHIFVKMLEASLDFSVPSKPKKIDLKNQALLPIIAPIRVLSLRFGIHETNTLDRIEKLKEKKVLSKEIVTDLKVAYLFLKNIHFLTQVKNIRTNAEKINLIDVKKDLPKIKAKFLEDSLKTISEFQNLLEKKFLFTYFGMR